MPPLGTLLNSTQWAFVRSLRHHVDAWNLEEDVTSEAMGRAAAKVENVEAVLEKLEEEAQSVAERLQRYKHRRKKVLHTDWGHRGDPGEVVGSDGPQAWPSCKSSGARAPAFLGRAKF